MTNAALQALSMTDLVALHNKIPGVTPVTTKTFSTRAKAVARIEKIAAEKKVNLATLQSGGIDKAAAKPGKPAKADKPAKAPKAEATGEKPKRVRKAREGVDPVKSAKAKGVGIGEAVLKHLKDPALHSYEKIAELVNAEIKDANTSAKSVAWYACQARKEDPSSVPQRPRAGKPKVEATEAKPKKTRAKKAAPAEAAPAEGGAEPAAPV